MGSKNRFKKIYIKNNVCYYLDYTMRVIDINSREILLDEKQHENILVYDISYKTFIGSIPLRIRFDWIDGFIKIYDGIRDLVLFSNGWYDKVCDRNIYLISKKSGIADSINHKFARIRIDSYNSLPIKRILTFHVCILSLLYFDIIDVSEGTDVNKTIASKKWDICHYWYFLNKGFKFQPNICNRCHDLLLMFMSYTNTAILNIKGSNYGCVISAISKNEAINVIQNADFTKESGTL